MLNDSKALKLILLAAFIVAALISLSIRLSWSHNQKEADFAASSSTSVTINAVDSAISVRRSEDGRVHARLAHWRLARCTGAVSRREASSADSLLAVGGVGDSRGWHLPVVRGEKPLGRCLARVG